MDASQQHLAGSLLEYVPLLREIESRFNVTSVRRYVGDNFHVLFAMDLLYLASVFAGTSLMKSRGPFNLRRELFLWNVGLATFSFYGVISIGPNLIHSIYSNGFTWTTCNGTLATNPHLALWEFLFAFFKIVEMGDTAFVILRKSSLKFLHWYHHFSVYLFCFYGYGFPVTSAIEHYYAFINFFVHTLMYTYFALKAVNVRVPSSVALVITMLQILQMFAALGISLYAYANHKSGAKCDLTLNMVYAAILLYSSYVVLFVHFFYKRYVAPRI